MKNKFCKIFYKIKINEFFYCNNLLIYYVVPNILLFNINKKVLFNIFNFYKFNFSFIKNSYVLDYLKKKYDILNTLFFANFFKNSGLYCFFFNLELNSFIPFIKILLKVFDLSLSLFFILYENYLVYFDKNKNLLINNIVLTSLIFYIIFFLYIKFLIIIKKIL